MTQNDIDKISKLNKDLTTLNKLIAKLEKLKYSWFSIFVSTTTTFNTHFVGDVSCEIPTRLNDKIIKLIYEERDIIQRQLDEIQCNIKGE